MWAFVAWYKQLVVQCCDTWHILSWHEQMKNGKKLPPSTKKPTYYNGTYISSQSNTKGQCVKASGSAKWIMTDCADTLGKGFVCQMDQNVEEVGKKSGYLMLFKIVFVKYVRTRFML